MRNATTNRENARKGLSRKRDGTQERMKVWKQERKDNILNAIKFAIIVILFLLGCRI